MLKSRLWVHQAKFYVSTIIVYGRFFQWIGFTWQLLAIKRFPSSEESRTRLDLFYFGRKKNYRRKTYKFYNATHFNRLWRPNQGPFVCPWEEEQLDQIRAQCCLRKVGPVDDRSSNRGYVDMS
ncbi:unnamed protein product [Cyprideis torosa]|uniref:Uncharacterized protein n=1 Tax=Cyprideis torosa TaxID=163714 RepID=A0A7R8WEC0_9CRUS|nr:unnamed protein product [Cyprideis torosa]CAG0890507.1 unnamed protein product [Cyprideis torosa]